MFTECLCKCFQKRGSLENWLAHPPWSRACCKRYTVISNTECFNYELVNCINLMLLWFIIAMLAWFLVVLPYLLLGQVELKSITWGCRKMSSTEARSFCWMGFHPGSDCCRVSMHSLYAAVLCSCCALCTLHTGLCSWVGVLGQLFKHHVVKHIRKLHAWFGRTFPWWKVK